MHIGVLGVNFKTAGLALHEVIARNALAVFQEERLIPVVLLSTCNRTEIYFSAENLVSARDELQERIGLEEEESLYSYFDEDCFSHLCKVTSGLDSAIFLETEIASQVKLAYACACKRFVLPSVIHYVFQKSFKIAKSIRTLFLLQKRGSPTLFSTLWQIAEREWGDVREKKVLLVGHSRTHRRLSSFFMRKGVLDLTFCSRHPERVVGMNACGRDRLPYWNEYDLISCASQEDRFLICGEGKKEKHLIFDLSVPRNVDPDVESESVKLFNIEQINAFLAQTKDLLKEPLGRAESYIEESVNRSSRLYVPA